MYWGRGIWEGHFMLPEILKIFSPQKEDLFIQADFFKTRLHQVLPVHIMILTAFCM
jgi:hypothetical protein